MPETTEAKEWLERAEGKWRLQVLQKRGRNMPSSGAGGWVRHGLPLRVRRFLNGTPVGLMHDVLRILDETTEIPEDSLFNREPAETGATNLYNPVRTYIIKDGNPNESNGRDPTYTIVQDLRLAGDEGDGISDLPSESACSQSTNTSYVWDSPSVEPAPAGGQGVSYRVSNVVRDNETDLFSYQLQEQIAITHHMGPQVTECTEFEKVTTEYWDNLYGNEGSLDGVFYSNAVCRTGNIDDMDRVDFPEPCNKPDGTTIAVHIQKNPDCTYRATIERHEAVEDVLQSSETRKNLKGVTKSETVVSTNKAPEKGLALGEQVRNELRPDGLYNVTHVTMSTEDVGDTGSNCATTVFEHQHSDIRNEATRPESEATSAGGGRTFNVQSRATDEGTWDVTRTYTQELTSPQAQRSKRKTLRGVIESVTDRNVDDGSVTVTDLGDEVRVERTPGGLYNRTVTHVSAESVGDVGSTCEKTVFEHRHSASENVSTRPSDDAPAAGDGHTYQVQARATEEGTWDVVRTDVKEIASTNAQVDKRKSLRGVTLTTVDRNVTDGSVPSSLSLGDRVVVERTPGGLYNRTVTRVSAESVGSIGSNCEKTVFEHRHVESENVATRPEKEANSAGGGKVYQVQSRATDEGTWDVSRTTIEETEVPVAQHSMRKTLRGITETTVSRNVTDSSVEVSDVGDEVRVELTPGGRWNRTVVTASHEPVGEIGKSCTATPVVHTDSTTSNVPDGQQPEPQHQNPEVNVEKLVEVRRTEEGTWDVVERTSTHTPWGEQLIASAENDCQKVEIHAYQNLESVPEVSVGQGSSVSASANRNAVGSFDGSYRIVTGKPWGDEVIATADNDSQSVEIHAFQNLSAVPTMTAGAGETITANANRNELGLFDGGFRKVTGKPWGDVVIATAKTPMSETEFHAFQNLNSVPSVETGEGETVLSMSANRNDFGLFDGGYRRAKGLPYDSGWIKWDSETKTSRGIYKYHHGIRIFKNQKSPLLDGIEGSSVSVSTSVNEYGLFDGQLTYSDLYEWSEDSGGGGGGGGHQDGTTTIEQVMVDGTGKTYRRTVTMRVTSYYGTGNEGSEAALKANQTIPQGLSLPSRTYVNGNVNYGKWQADG